jgi:hypothetical protein
MRRIQTKARSGSAEERLAWLEEDVSTFGFKEWARKYLPLSSKVRGLMEMDDSMPRWRGVGQFEIISKLVEDEFKTL